MATNKGFSDRLSPEILCDWLATRLEANGLELKEEQRHILLEDEINGLAFRKLDDAELKEMGFRRGSRQALLKIIPSLSVEMEMPPVEKCNRTAKSAPITPNAPAIGCTMNFSPKITPVSESGPSNTEVAPACMPDKGCLWRKESLVVKFCNEEYLAEWDLTPDKVLECANRWSTGVVEGGNFIPKFEFNDSLPPDIIVELNKKEEIKSDVGYHVSRPAAKVHLDLCHNDPKYREHLIGHEFGHALGLGHEHQRSKLWKLIGNFVDINKMKLALQTKGGDSRYDDWKEDEHAKDGGSTEDYDPDSIMHYWFRREWLKDGYSDEATIIGHPALNEEARKALLRVPKRDGDLSTHPSPVDLKFLSDQYKMIRSNSSGSANGVSQIQNETTLHLSGRGLGPAPKRRRMDSESDDVILTIDDLNAVIDAPWKAGAKWKTIGMCIGVDVGTLATMRGSDDDRLREMLSHWLKGVYDPDEPNSKPRTWRTLIEALRARAVNEAAMADKLEKEHYQDHDNGATADDQGPSPHTDSSGLKEVSTRLLDQITWDGGKKKLRVYAKTAKKWRLIARNLGLEDEKPGCINEIAKRRSNSNIECVREVFGKWIENAVGLPNADQFPKSWEGLLNLLNESEVGEVAKELRTAIEAPDSSARREE